MQGQTRFRNVNYVLLCSLTIKICWSFFPWRTFSLNLSWQTRQPWCVNISGKSMILHFAAISLSKGTWYQSLLPSCDGASMFMLSVFQRFTLNVVTNKLFMLTDDIVLVLKLLSLISPTEKEKSISHALVSFSSLFPQPPKDAHSQQQILDRSGTGEFSSSRNIFTKKRKRLFHDSPSGHFSTHDNFWSCPVEENLSISASAIPSSARDQKQSVSQIPGRPTV